MAQSHGGVPDIHPGGSRCTSGSSTQHQGGGCSSTWQDGVGSQSHMQFKKLVSIWPTAKTGRIDYLSGDLSAGDQAIFRLFYEDR